MAAKNIDSFPGQVEVTSNLTVDTNTLHVDSITGRVGMGKTNPGYAMDVNGIVNATALYVNGTEFTGGGGGESVWTESGSDIYYTGGNVGIGTTAPQQPLEVHGPIRITDGGANVVDFDFGTDTSFVYGENIVAPDLQLGDRFGYSVSMSNDGSYAAIGEIWDNDNGPTTGAAFVFVRSGNSWSYQAKLKDPNMTPASYMGYSIAISSDGSYLATGSKWYSTPTVPQAGSVSIFVRSGSTWSHQSTLLHPDPAYQDYFGNSVSISDDGSLVLVGSPYDDNNFINDGSAHVFARSGANWSHQQVLSAPDNYNNDAFGYGVSISGDGSYALIGATSDYPTGSACIFVRSGTSWSFQDKIRPNSAYPSSYFGCHVSLTSDGSRALIGAYRENNRIGGAWVFSRSGSTWSEDDWLTAPDGAPYDYFGFGVSISADGSYALIAAYGDDDLGSNSGSAYVYARSGSTWSFKEKLKDPLGTSNAKFSRNAVSMSGDGGYSIIGAYRHSYVQSNGGTSSIYIQVPSFTVSKPIEADGTLLSFTGQHICFPEGPMEQGLVVSANKNKYVSLNGPLMTGSHAIRSNESLPVVSLSNVANDGTVFGVVDRVEQSGTTRTQESGIGIVRQDKEVGDNRVVVNSLGEGAIWVANTNGNIVSGDFLTTSHLPGYAQKQDDDILTNSTVAKSTMDCNFEPEKVPARIVLKDEGGNNVLDSYGRIQWVNDPEGVTTPEYHTRYLDVSGTPTDEANAVHIAAFVGCTYHCG